MASYCIGVVVIFVFNIYSGTFVVFFIIELLTKDYAIFLVMFVDVMQFDCQYLDSVIALRVLKIMHKQNITCIPIHDSFIVQEKYSMQIKNAMRSAFQSVFPNIKPRIK